MIMTTEYFMANVDMALEFEEENGHRFWVNCKGNETNAVYKEHKKMGYYFSDEDYCSKQSNDEVRRFLNLVCYNADHNPKYNGMGWWILLDVALDKWDY